MLKKAILGAVLLSVWTISQFFPAVGPRKVEAADRVIFSLGWLPQGYHTGMYTALGKGFYKKKGMFVSIVRGWGGGESIQSLGVGKYDFAITGGGTFVSAKSKGTPVISTGIFLAKAQDVIFALDGSGITKPEHLKGKSVGAGIWSAPWVIFPAFAAATGLSMKSITWRNVNPGAEIPSLLAGKVDVVVEYLTSYPAARRAAKKVGRKIVRIFYDDYGVDTYGLVFTATNKMVKEKADLVRWFMHASMEGFAWAIKHLKEAVNLFIQHNPHMNKDLASETWVQAIDSILVPNAKKNGIGHAIREKWTHTRDILRKYMKLPKSVPVDELYTNQFLPKIIPK